MRPILTLCPRLPENDTNFGTADIANSNHFVFDLSQPDRAMHATCDVLQVASMSALRVQGGTVQ